MAQPRQRVLLLVAAMAFAIAGTFFFGYRFGRHARRIHWLNEPIQSWMSLPYIAHSHHVSPEILYKAIGLEEPAARDRRPVRELAREQKQPVSEIIRKLESAIAAARSPAKGP